MMSALFYRLCVCSMTILVNRGWVPASHKNPNKRRAGQVEGEMEIVGIVRLSEKRTPFTPKNQPHAWFYRCVLCAGI